MSSTTPKFFGLTALGAPDPFHTKLADTLMIDIFTDEDVSAAYSKKELPGGGVMIEGEFRKCRRSLLLGGCAFES